MIVRRALTGLLVSVAVASVPVARCARAGQVVLGPATELEVVERGEFGDAAGHLAQLLQKYVGEAVRRPDARDQPAAGVATRIRFVIEADAPRWSQLPAGSAADPGEIDAFAIRVVDGHPPEVHLHGKTVQAAGFAVMYFLEEWLGYLWAMPGELGVCHPRTSCYRLPAGTQRIAPAMFSRVMTGFVLRDPAAVSRGVDRAGLLQERRGFFFAYDYFKALKLNPLASPSHNMIHIVPPAMAETDPDVFPLVDGERWVPPPRGVRQRGGHGTWQAFHPCYSSPRLLERTLAKAAETYESGRLCFSLGINDGRCVRCECDACLAAGFPASYFRYVHATAEAVASRWPGRLVGLIAYGDVKNPPAHLELPENVLVMVVGGGAQAIDRWSRHAGLVGTYEHFFGVGWWYPNLPLASMQANASYYARRGVRCYRGEWHPLWAWDGPRVWIAARLQWDPELDLDRALTRYCAAAFGTAATAMEAFYREFATLCDDWVVQDGVSPLLGPSGAEKLCLDPLRQFACPDSVFARAARHLEQATTQAARDADEKVARRVDMVKTFFDFGETARRLATLAQHAFDPAARAPSAVELQRALDRRTSLLAKMADHAEWFAGTGAAIEPAGRPNWFERSAVDLPRMAENAILAAELRSGARAGRTETVRLLVKRQHPWYQDAQKYEPLRVESSAGAATFQTGSAAGAMSDHPKWRGVRKHHWMAALVRDIPADTSGVLAVDVRATATGGRLTVRATVKHAGVAQPAAMTLVDFGSESHTAQRRLIVEPVVTVQREGALARRRARAEEDRPGRRLRGANVDLHVIWEPATDDARLDGALAVERLVWR